jgi:hypothetical protein
MKTINNVLSDYAKEAWHNEIVAEAFPDPLQKRVEELTKLLESAETTIQNIRDLATIGQSYPTGANYRRIANKCRVWLEANARALGKP